MALLYGTIISAEVSFVLSQFTRSTDGETDGQTDGNLVGSTALHSMQLGKNLKNNCSNTVDVFRGKYRGRMKEMHTPLASSRLTDFFAYDNVHVQNCKKIDRQVCESVHLSGASPQTPTGSRDTLESAGGDPSTDLCYPPRTTSVSDRDCLRAVRERQFRHSARRRVAPHLRRDVSVLLATVVMVSADR